MGGASPVFDSVCDCTVMSTSVSYAVRASGLASYISYSDVKAKSVVDYYMPPPSSSGSLKFSIIFSTFFLSSLSVLLMKFLNFLVRVLALNLSLFCYIISYLITLSLNLLLKNSVNY